MNPAATFIACVIGFCLTAGVIIAAIVGGGTFGARCERMHPGDALVQERCVFDLSRTASMTASDLPALLARLQSATGPFDPETACRLHALGR